MPKLALSDLKLRSLPAPAKGQQDYWDASLPGFGIRVSQGGSKTFILNIDNARRSIGRFGVLTLAEARGEAKRILAERTLGRVRPQFVTFQQARDEFLEEKRVTRRASTHRDLKRFLTLYFPFKGGLAEATHHEITHRLNKITAIGERNHTTAAVKSFFTWCVKKRYLTENPTTGLYLLARPTRSRVLSEDELRWIWRATESPDLPEAFRTIVKLLILTGQRRGEITGLQLSFLKEGTCTFPAALTKNGREHTIPITAWTASVLQKPIGAISPTSGDALLFPARGRPTKPFNGWSKTKVLLDELSGVSDWTLHDLRRTFATRLAEMGTPIHVVEKLLNHISGTTGGLVGIYQRHQYWDEQVKAAVAWNDRLQRIIAS